MDTSRAQPIWLFSKDSDQFYGPPTTTAALQSWYLKYGRYPDNKQFSLIHFQHDDSTTLWFDQWWSEQATIIKTCLEKSIPMIAGFSFYTWNTAEFLQLAKLIKQACPEILIIAGGPHVQQAEDYLFDEAIDIIVLGEGEETFCELLDTLDPNNLANNWQDIDGIAYTSDNQLVITPERPRIKDLSLLPSPLDALTLTDDQGKPLYEAISYETSRGCPFTCAFCEWGTGAIGTKMLMVPMERIRKDWEMIVQSGIKDIWLADSNYGALKNDLEKAELLVELKQKYNLPSTFATSWSKTHNKQVQQIVRLLHQHELLPHYQLALQTLTPLALELSHRENMKANQYEPIARQMATEGIPIAGELIWGLPGDNLVDFEKNLDKLLQVFPNMNIFGYTLLPGTEFYDKRHEYKIKSVPVAGYGKAHGEYVVGCHTFSEEEGIEGYFLITAYIVFVHGYLLPLTARLFVLQANHPDGLTLGSLLRQLLSGLIKTMRPLLPELDWDNKLLVYENRSALYLTLLEQRETCFTHIEKLLDDIFSKLPEVQKQQLLATIQVDELFCPRTGNQQTIQSSISADVETIKHHLESMELPPANAFTGTANPVEIFHSGGAGTFLQDPDGGSWIKGKIVNNTEPRPALA